jgi:hypothetical protein
MVSARAHAQTQANITPHVEDESEYGYPAVTVPPDPITFNSNDADVLLGCAQPNTSYRVLQFDLNTFNDGYATYYLDSNTMAAYPDAFYYRSGINYPLLRNFASFVLLDATTKAPVLWSDGQGHSGPVSNVKEYFDLADDDHIDNRSDAPDQSHRTCVGQGIECLDRGWYDVYATGITPCQWVRIDGVPDGDYDLVIDEDAARLLVCSASNDANCPLDGRVFDNATSVRVRLTTTNGVTQASVVPPVAGIGNVITIGPAATVAGPPAVVTHNVNAYDLFYVGTNGALYTVSQGSNGVWPSGSDGAQVFTGYPSTLLAGGSIAAVAVDRVRTDVFGRTTNGSVLWVSNAVSGSGWSAGFYGVGVGIAGRPVAVASGPKSALVAWMTPQGAVAYGRFDGANWLTPQTLPGTYVASQTPALTSSGDGTFELFVRDASGAVWFNQLVGTTWSGWTGLGGAASGDLTAASPYLSCADVFLTTADHKLMRKTWSGVGSPACGCATVGGFCGWTDDIAVSSCLEGTLACSQFDGNTGSAPTAISAGPQKLDVFYYDKLKPDMLWQLHFDGTATPPWRLNNLGRIAVVQPMWPIVASSWADNEFDVYQKFSNGWLSARSQR